MAAPNASPVTIEIATNDVSANIRFETMRLERNNLDVGYFECEVDKPTTAPAIGDLLTIVDNTASETLFYGNIIELDERKYENGIQKQYRIRAADTLNRLRRAVLPFLDLSGSDRDILAALLANAYPDLSSLFDFDLDVDNLLNDFAFNTNNENLLEALQRFGDELGIGYLAFDPPQLGSGAIFNYFHNPKFALSSDTDKYVRGFPPPYDTYSTNPNSYGTTVTVASGGAVSGNYVRLPALVSDGSGLGNGTLFTLGESEENVSGTTSNSQIEIPSSAAGTSFVRFTFYLRCDTTITTSNYNLAIDNFITSTAAGTFSNRVSSGLLTGEWERNLTANTWYRMSITTSAISGANYRGVADPFKLSAVFKIEADSSAYVFDISNVVVDVVPSTFSFATGAPYRDGDTEFYKWEGTVNDSFTLDGDSKTELNLTETPLQSDFDIDVQSGNEFARDIEFSLGSPDYFNSVFVIGGFEDVAVDWTYESDGAQDHFDLETAFKDIVVYRNDGTDGTPSWTQLTGGVWGKDELGVAGVEVLYDEADHWLLFETAPSNLAKAFRVTGSIKKPIRVRVDAGADGEPVLASTVYDENVTTTDEAVTIGQSELNKRNQPANLRFKTYHPGLLPGREINITDSARGLDQDVIIQRITTTWLGASGHALHDVECGVEPPRGLDTLIAGNDVRSRPKPTGGDTTTSVVTFLVDEDGTQLIDEDGQNLYEVT